MATRGNVLVLDGDKVPALDIVRTLGKAGLDVTVGARRDDAIAFRSRYARRRVTYPDAALGQASFITWLEDTLRRDRYDLVVPVTDLTVIPISQNFESLGTLSALATESYDKMQIVCDKSRTLELARRLGVPAPSSIIVRRMEELDGCSGTLKFPLVCKPLATSVWSESGFQSFPVFYALDENQLRAEVQTRIAACPIILQEYKTGTGVGVEVLAQDGVILQAFQHLRLHELPLTGGGSTYRMSVAVDPGLRGYSSRLLQALRWTGVAMVEFKVEAGGAATLMEINGRFWGSLPLSSRAGMSFAADLYEMLALGKTPAARSYLTGVRCRKLQDDVEWFKENLSLDHRRPEVRAGLVQRKSVGALLADAARLLSPAEYYDVQVLWDPAPGLLDGWQTVRTQLAGVRRRLARLAETWRSGWYRMRRRTRLIETLRPAEKVLFVCYGNIMRSPFASSYVQHRASGNGWKIETRSAGMHNKVGRAADPRTIAAGRRRGLDLSSHRSRKLDDTLVGWADVILVMDRANLRDVQRHYPAAVNKVFLLGVLDPGMAADVQIPDPYLSDAETTEGVFARIGDAVDRLVRAAAPRTPGDRSR